MINLKEMFVALGYSERGWKGQKSRILGALGHDKPKETFMVEVEDAKEILEYLADGKGKYKGAAAIMLSEGKFKEMTNQYIEESKPKSGGKKCDCVANAKKVVTMKDLVKRQKNEIDRLVALLEANGIEMEEGDVTEKDVTSFLENMYK